MKSKTACLIFLYFCSVSLFLQGCSKHIEESADKHNEVMFAEQELMMEEADISPSTSKFVSSNIEGENADVANFITTKAAVSVNDGEKKFIRTAHLRLEVKDVVAATHAIEDVIIAKDGFIINSVINSQELYSEEVRVGKDSALVRSYNRYNADLELRVHHTFLDEALRQIASCAGKAVYRSVNADEVTFSLMGNRLAQERKSEKLKRLKDISGAGKGHKLDGLLKAEDEIDKARESADNALIEELKMQDRIEYSFIIVALEQEPVMTKTMKYIDPQPQAYRSGFFWKTLDALEGGWHGFLEVIVALFYIWPLILLLGGGIFAIIYYRRKKRN